jgi:hypothetical protein
MTDYVEYAPGSFWIYRDSVKPANKDSVAIIANNISWTGHVTWARSQAIAVTCFSSIDGTQIFHGISSGNDNFAYRDTTGTIYYEFQFPFKGSDAINNFDFTPCPDTMTVRNKQYRDVVEFHNDAQKKTVFWSKHVGVIKSFSNGKVWELDTCVVQQ